MLPLLSAEEDLVVRLAAAKALKVVIDDFEFCPQEMEPFLPTAFNQLFFLLKQVQECDTKVTYSHTSTKFKMIFIHSAFYSWHLKLSLKM